MPTYLYRRKDGSTFEIEQKITEPALINCPTTGQSVTRLISGGAGLVFKGSGFYITDYARNGKSPSSEKKSEPASKSTDSESSNAKSGDSGSSSDDFRTVRLRTVGDRVPPGTIPITVFLHASTSR